MEIQVDRWYARVNLFPLNFLINFVIGYKSLLAWCWLIIIIFSILDHSKGIQTKLTSTWALYKNLLK